MADTTIDQLQIQISAQASQAMTSITKLSNSLRALGQQRINTNPIKDFVKEMSSLKDQAKGLSAVGESLSQIAKAVKVFSTQDAEKMARMQNNMKGFAESVKELNKAGSYTKGLQKIADSVSAIADKGSQIKGVAAAIAQVEKATNKSGSASGGAVMADSTGTSAAKTEVEGAATAAEKSAKSLREVIKGFEESSNAAILWKSQMSSITSAIPGDIGQIERMYQTWQTFSKVFGSDSDYAKEAQSRLNEALKNVGLTVDDLKKRTTELNKELKKLADETEKAGASAQGASGRFKTLLSDIIRIAKYRAIRTFIKGLTTAIKEGFNMFATWDKEMNGGMAGVANNVAAVTEKWTILKGQIGAAAGALFNSFAPVITFILDGLTKIIDVFQMVIRSLQGEYTYYHLIYKEADATTGAAKELKRVLFGFDDLNVLPSQTGGGAAVTNGTWAYEELPITSEFLNKIADGSNKLREFLGIGKDTQNFFGGLTGVVGTLIGAKALGGLLGLLPRLIGGFKNKNKVLGEQSTKTETETSKVTQLATAFSAATAAAFGLKELLKNWKINIPTTVQDPVPQLQSAYSAASLWLAQKVLTAKTAVSSFVTALSSAWTTAKTWLAQKVLTAKTAVSSFVTALSNAWGAAKTWLAQRLLTVKTTISDFLNSLKLLWGKASMWLSTHPLTIPTVIGVAGLAIGLISLISSLQNQANLNPIHVPTALETTGLATGLSNYLQGLQDGLNNSPLTISTQIITGIRDAKNNLIGGLFNKDSLEGWSIKSSQSTPSFYSPTMSATDYINYAESTGLNLTSQDRAVGIATAGAILAAPIAAGLSTLSGAGALGGLSASELLKALGIAAYADGGIIPNGVGSLFVAGERGAEVVANLGHSTGVTNVDQMADAVAEGNASVVEALYAVLRAIQSKDSNVYLDGAKIGQSVSRYQQNQARRGVAYNG